MGYSEYIALRKTEYPYIHPCRDKDRRPLLTNSPVRNYRGKYILNPIEKFLFSFNNIKITPESRIRSCRHQPGDTVDRKMKPMVT